MNGPSDGALNNDDSTAHEVKKKSHFGFLKRRKKNANEDAGGQQDGEEKKVKKHYGFWPQLKAAVFGSWINVILVCVPVGIALHCKLSSCSSYHCLINSSQDTSVDPKVVFVINFLAIIPLAGILSYATEEIALRVGETLGGLLNASFG